MAVFTPVTQLELEEFISPAQLGQLVSFEGILQGVDNTNYKIATTTGKYILTIFEGRINPDDLPYFLGFMEHLNQNDLLCPSLMMPCAPLKHKPAAIFSFLEGQGTEPDQITPSLCHELGIFLGKMHLAGQSFQKTRHNSMSFDAWEDRFHHIGRTSSSYVEHLHLIKQKWPKTLPMGAIHADLFPDNVFIKDHHIHGVIDFYFSCTDFLAYDLAIVMNAWCFDGKEFNHQKWHSLLDGYQSIRPLQQDEKDSYQILCQGAALRFLSSRLHDFVFHDPKNHVIPKTPDEYIQKLEFHTHAKLF